MLQILGVVLIVGGFAFWAISGKESTLFVGAGVTLAALGSAGGAIVTVRQETTERAEEHQKRLRELQNGQPESARPIAPPPPSQWP